MKKKQELSISLSELLYLCFVCIMLFVKGIGLYDGQLLYKLFFAGSIGLLFVKMLITKHSIKEWIVIVLIGLLTIIVYLNSREKGVLICSLTVLSMKDVSVEKVMKTGLWTWGVTMGGNVLYHLLNLSASGYKVHEKLGLGHIFRWDLGFSHPNVLHISYLVLCGFVVYNLDKKYNWKYALLLMIGNLFVFIYSVSYTGIMVVTLYLGLAWYMNTREKMSKCEYILLELIFPVCLLLSLLSPILLPENVFNIVNKIFSNRLVLAKYYLISDNLKFFGNNLGKITTHILTMDNAYVFSLIIYGILFFIVLVSGYFMLIRLCVKTGKNKELAVIVCFLIGGITEPFLFNTSFKNITLFFLGVALFSKKDMARVKEVGLIPKLNKDIVLNCTNVYVIVKNIAKSFKENKKRILLFAVSMGIIASIWFGANREMPEGYIVPRIYVDIESDETWYITSKEASEYKELQILDYKDGETKMQILKGNIVMVEYFRGIISVFCVTVVLSGVITAVGLSSKYFKKNRD